MRTRRARSRAAGNSHGHEQVLVFQPVSSISVCLYVCSRAGCNQVARKGNIWFFGWERASVLDEALLTGSLNVFKGTYGVRISTRNNPAHRGCNEADKGIRASWASFPCCRHRTDASLQRKIPSLSISSYHAASFTVGQLEKNQL